MRSLIILAVEHGEDTDGLAAMTEHLVSDTDWFGNGSLTIVDHTVRVDIPDNLDVDSLVGLAEWRKVPLTISNSRGETTFMVSPEARDALMNGDNDSLS